MRNFTKWPQLLVSDSKVSKDLAAEIIIRTSGLYASCNDHLFEHEVRSAFGLNVILYDYNPKETNRDRIKKINEIYKQEALVKQELNILDLEYLHNSQIVSSYIGGPHGWINWDGDIGCYEFIIGKWPSHEKVLQEWKLIANTWPELDFRSQLIPDEGECDSPVVEYIIKNGTVKVIEDPIEKLQPKNSGLKNNLSDEE